MHHAQPGDAAYAALTLLSELMKKLVETGALMETDRQAVVTSTITALEAVPQGSGAAEVMKTLYYLKT